MAERSELVAALLAQEQQAREAETRRLQAEANQPQQGGGMNPMAMAAMQQQMSAGGSSAAGGGGGSGMGSAIASAGPYALLAAAIAKDVQGLDSGRINMKDVMLSDQLTKDLGDDGFFGGKLKSLSWLNPIGKIAGKIF